MSTAVITPQRGDSVKDSADAARPAGVVEYVEDGFVTIHWPATRHARRGYVSTLPAARVVVQAQR
jgi:hypothetical protein